MGSAPYFPQYANEFLADVSGWPVEAVGAYARLQCQAWKDDPVGSLPNNDEVLARQAGVNLVVWRKMRPIVLSLCKTGTDGRVHFPRLRAAFEEHRRYSKSRAENASRGWEKRRGEKIPRAPDLSSPDAYASDVHCSSPASAPAISAASSKRRDAPPRDEDSRGESDRLAPSLNEFEIALAGAKGWRVDVLTPDQYRQVRQYAGEITAAHNGSATPAVAAAIPGYYGDRRWGLRFARDDWAQIVEFARGRARSDVGRSSASPAPVDAPAEPASPRAGAWGRVLAAMEAMIGVSALEAWFYPIEFEVREEAVVLRAPAIVRDWVSDHYKQKLGAALSEAGLGEYSVRFEEAHGGGDV